MGAILLAGPAIAAPATLVSQSFDHLTVQSFTGAANNTVGDSELLGQLTLATSTGTTLAISGTAGANVLKFTDNQAGGSAPTAYSNVFTGVSTTATGNNRILGCFDFTPLSVASGNAPSFVFMINADGLVNSGPSSSVMITFAPTAGVTNSPVGVSYTDGGTSSGNVATLSANTRYRVELTADYSKTGAGNFDTYSFIIRNLDAATIHYRSPAVINTRANADKVPNRIAFYGGASSTVANSSPFFQIDNIRFISGDGETRPFVWGVSGHPCYNSATSYWSAVPLTATAPAVGQLNLVEELGCSYYRVDAGDPTRFSQLANDAQTKGLKLLPVIGVSVDAVILNTGNGYPTLTSVYDAAKAVGQAFAAANQGRFTHIEIGNEYDNPSILGDTYSGEVASHYKTDIYPRAMMALKGLSDGIRAGGELNAKRIINAGWYHYGFIDMLIADGVPFEVLGWHWYSGMGSMNRVMKKLSSYGMPIWITETDRTQGSQITTPVFSNDFQADPLNTTPVGWTPAGSWQVQQRGSGSSMVRAAVNLTAAGANTLTKTLPTALTNSWELEFYYDWTYGGTSTFGNYDKIIDCDMTDGSDNGYRVRVRQGNSNDPAKTASVLGIYKLTGGSPTLLPGAGAQGQGYNRGGYANYGGVPSLQRITFRWDSIDKRLFVDRTGIDDKLVSGDSTWNNFTKLTFRITASSEQPLLDNITLKTFEQDQDLQAEKLGELLSEIWNTPQVEALFVYELLDQPNLTAFTNGESAYGLCRIERNGAGQYAFHSRKSAFTLYQSAINGFGTVPSGGDIIVDDSYPKPATKYSSTTAWTEDSTLAGYFYRGYKQDGGIVANKGNTVRFYTHIPAAGNYKVYVRHPVSATNAAAVPVKIGYPTAPRPLVAIPVDQNTGNGDWVLLGTFPFNAWQPGNPYNPNWETEADAAYVEIGNAGTTSRVTADAVRFKRMP